MAADTIPRLKLSELRDNPQAFVHAMTETGFVVLTDIGDGEKLHRDMMTEFATFVACRYHHSKCEGVGKKCSTMCRILSVSVDLSASMPLSSCL